jgi:hypothetical protein
MSRRALVASAGMNMEVERGEKSHAGYMEAVELGDRLDARRESAGSIALAR